ncbi:hypothetical protein CHS0354_025622 [Potamilus streckersoni]|uniref:Uncharacterized protein n=1 Tax=Potamilus streckersoni TaxID=2493646 RepID=A0AAE0S1Q9_9BIVA|nr:hypothetical protein CHS0354_025622 [Potamilus streckersoni]
MIRNNCIYNDFVALLTSLAYPSKVEALVGIVTAGGAALKLAIDAATKRGSGLVKQIYKRNAGKDNLQLFNSVFVPTLNEFLRRLHAQPPKTPTRSQLTYPLPLI